MRWLKDNALSLAFLVMFVLALAGQAVAGTLEFNDRQVAGGGEPVSVPHFVASSDFAVDVAENWQSEYLQFFLFIMLTVWLVQRGSPESKQPGEAACRTGSRSCWPCCRWWCCRSTCVSAARRSRNRSGRPTRPRPRRGERGRAAR